MANTRIKDISTAATTLNSDDFIAVDGSTAGTRKMAKADLITEVSTGVSGTYLEESNNLSDVASKDTSKLNMEIPDVGSAGNEVSLNSMLGTMAFQDSAGVSVGQLEVTDKVDGNLTVEGTSGEDALTVGNTLGGTALKISATEGTSTSINSGAGGTSRDLIFKTGNSERMRIQGGNVGIGTASPGAKIHSEDTVTDNSSAEVARIQGTSSAGGTNTSLRFTAASSASDANNRWFGIQAYDHNPTARALVLQHNGGNVGIGTTSPGATYKLDVSGDIHTDAILRMSRAGNFALYPGSSNIIYQLEQAGTHWFKTDGNTVAQIDSSYNLNVNLGNLVFGTSGKGIDFGSGASTTLDDYEEGTWTPTVGSITAGPTAGAGAAYSGTYTKIGRLVQCSINLDFDDTGTAVAVDDRFTFGSLPFSVIPAQDTYTGAGSLFIYASTGAGNNALGTVGITQSGDSLVCYVTHLDGSLNYGRNVRAVFSYETDA